MALLLSRVCREVLFWKMSEGYPGVQSRLRELLMS